jgi:cation-transporting ATPase F
MTTTPLPATDSATRTLARADHRELLAQHGVHPDHGLGEEEAAARLARHGPNRPSQQPGRSALARFLAS